MSAQERLPWERQEGESSKMFAAFCAYRDLGPAERSLNRVASQGEHGSWSPLAKASSEYGWVRRASAWDDEQDRAKRDAMRQEAVEMGRRQATEAVAMQRVMMAPVRAFLLRMQADPLMLDHLRDMDVVELFDLAREATRAYPHAVKVERLARGESTEHLEVSRSGEQVPVIDDDRTRQAAVLAKLQEVGFVPRALDEAVVDVEVVE